jgi:hypothetical protein
MQIAIQITRFRVQTIRIGPEVKITQHFHKNIISVKHNPIDTKLSILTQEAYENRVKS